MATLVVVIAGCEKLSDTLSNGGDPERLPLLQREVLAVYFAWLENPESWFGAKGVYNAAHRPARGVYDSRDPRIFPAHVREAREAGITGFICSWEGRGAYQDRLLPSLVAAAREVGLKISILLEQAPSREEVVENFEYLLDRYGKEPAWLRVPDGRLVVFIYVRPLAQLSEAAIWKEIMNRFRDRIFFSAFADSQLRGEDWSTFDMYWYYSYVYPSYSYTTVEKVDDQLADFFRRHMRGRAAKGRYFAATVEPGLDKTAFVLHRPAPELAESNPVTPRLNGDYYRARWRAALKSGAPWIIINSWNEWIEGQEIEPSVEEGDLYLRLTREYAVPFLAGSQR